MRLAPGIFSSQLLIGANLLPSRALARFDADDELPADLLRQCISSTELGAISRLQAEQTFAPTSIGCAQWGQRIPRAA